MWAKSIALRMKVARLAEVLAMREKRCLVDSKKLKFQPPMEMSVLRCGQVVFFACSWE